MISGPDDVDRDFGSSSSNLRFATAGGTTTKTYNYPGGNNKLSSITQGATTHRSFSYDGASNISADTRGATAYNYHYNNRNRLDELTIGSTVTADYTYDGLERLAIRTTQNMTPAGTTHYVYDLAGHLIAESTDTGTTTREYVWLNDMPLAVVADVDTPSPNLYYVHADHLDRPLKMTDGTEAVVWDAVYNPFGDVNAITGSASNNLRFPGQYFLIESGLHYNWYRHYDPTLGRYTQTDPLGFVDGPAIYPYARSAPGMYADPDGQFLAPLVPIIIGIGVGITVDYIISKAKEACSCQNANSVAGPVGNAVAGGAVGLFGPYGTKSVGAFGSRTDTTVFSQIVGAGFRSGLFSSATRNFLRRIISRRASYFVPGATYVLLVYELIDLAKACTAEK